MLVAKEVEHKRVMCESLMLKRQAALCKVRVLVVGMLHFSHPCTVEGSGQKKCTDEGLCEGTLPQEVYR